MGLVHVQNKYIDQFHYTPDDRDADKLEVLHLNFFAMGVLSCFGIATMVFTMFILAIFENALFASLVLFVYTPAINLFKFIDERRTLQDYGL